MLPLEKRIVDFDAYRRFFDESELWNKIKKVSRKAGIKAVYVALLLYYMARDPSISRKEKMKIYGALGYFILPTDMLPDAILGLGFSDDFAVLAWVIYSVSTHITPDIERQAEEKLREWFGDYDRAEIAGLLPVHTD